MLLLLIHLLVLMMNGFYITECVQLCAEVVALKKIVSILEKAFKDSVESNFNL